MNIKDSNQQELPLLPSFGSSMAFSSIAEDIKYGDNHSQRMLKGINALSMSANLKFEELDDLQSRNLISFLQKHHYYQPQNYISDGSFNNKRIEPFDYQPFYPYKKNKFFCISFVHEKQYYNVNSVSATFTANTASILDSVESKAGHNNVTDAVISATIGSTSSVSNNNVELRAGNIIYHSGDYVNAEINSAFQVSKGGSDTLDASVRGSNFTFDEPATISSQHTPFRNSIFINDPNECSYYPYEPSTSHQLVNFRMFDFRPSQSISLNNSPKYRDSSVSDAYKKFNKYGFNPNLMNLRLSFKGRSDLEAKRILLFLESHLGLNKFGFHVLEEYGNKIDSINTSPHRKDYSTFYCPEWDHTFKYKDNHEINATFIECVNY